MNTIVVQVHLSMEKTGIYKAMLEFVEDRASESFPQRLLVGRVDSSK